MGHEWHAERKRGRQVRICVVHNGECVFHIEQWKDSQHEIAILETSLDMPLEKNFSIIDSMIPWQEHTAVRGVEWVIVRAGWNWKVKRTGCGETSIPAV